MRRTLVGFLVTLVCVAGGSSTASAASPPDRLYVALGDSLAAGVGASVPGAGGYVPRLFETLKRPGRWRVGTLVNVGVGGETTGSILGEQLDRATAAIEDPRTDVRVLTLDIGGNDALGIAACAADPDGPECPIVANYTTLLRRLSKALDRDRGREALLVMAYPNFWSGTGLPFEGPVAAILVGADGRIDCAGGADDVGVNDILACHGLRFGFETVDVYPLFVGRGFELTNLAFGDFHPNDAGHALIADAFARETRNDDRGCN